jgi:hypothetical protein
VSGVPQQPDHVASERSRSACDEDVHPNLIIVSERRRACRPRTLNASAGLAGPLRSGPLSPSTVTVS